MVRVSHIVVGLVVILGTPVMAAPPSPKLTRALCTRSATLLACVDAYDNRYNVAMSGTTLYLRGFESAGNRSWAQTNSRYGALTFFTGLASDGEAWVGTIQKVGWTTISRVSSSSGTRSRITCDRVMGCR